MRNGSWPHGDRWLSRERKYGGFNRHEGATGGFYKVKRAEEGASSYRAEHAAACITLEDLTRYAESQRPLHLLTDPKCLLMAI